MARPIDTRFLPPVAGIDLEQSLNYLSLEDVPVDFIYERYTGARLPYIAGSRPVLEAIAQPMVGATPFDTVQTLANWVATQVPWAGFYQQAYGKPLPPDRNLTEEQIIDSGYGWCNEQARLLCCLTQVVGIPSRLVFGANLQKRYGHVVVETLMPEGWMMVDESFGLCFVRNDKPVRAYDVFHDADNRAYFGKVYGAACDALISQLGRENLVGSFNMCLGPEPLDGFKDLGYHNHFAH